MHQVIQIKKKVEQKVEHSHKLDQLDKRILLTVSKYQINKQISVHLKIPKSTVSYHTKKLTALGLLTEIGLNPKIFEPTPAGKMACSTFLTGYGAKQFEPMVRSHNIRFKSKITQEPENLVERLLKNNWIEYTPNNWKGYINHIFNAAVIFTPKSVQYMLPEFYDYDVAVNMDAAVRLVFKIKEYLEDCYPGLVLGKPEEVATLIKQHHAIQYDPEALEYYKYNEETGSTLTSNSGRISVDHSNNVPETETIHKVHGKEDLEKIFKLYGEVVETDFSVKEHLSDDEKRFSMMMKSQDKIIDSMQTFAIGMKEHMKLIRMLQKLVGSLDKKQEDLFSHYPLFSIVKRWFKR